MPKRNQDKLIKNLNEYLESHDLPVRMDEEGVCLGLAALRCQYFLEDKEQEYYLMLDKISNPENLKRGIDPEVNHFVVQILNAFQPKLFDSRKKQKDALSTLKLSGESILKFGMIASDEQWVKALDTINLQKDEIMLVSVPGHAFSISRTPNNQYRLADPREPQGYQDYPDTRSLMAAVHENNPVTKSFALHINLLRRTGKEPRAEPIPSKRKLFSRDVDAVCEVTNGKTIWTQGTWACRKDDLKLFKWFLRHKTVAFNERLHLIQDAVAHDSTKILAYCLDNKLYEYEPCIIPALLASLVHGSYKSFEMLVDLAEKHNIFTSKNDIRLINKASTGGNPDILKYVLDKYTTILTPNKIAEKILEKHKNRDSIEAAIGEKGNCGLSNTECVSLLLDKVLQSNHKLSQKQLLHYLLLAVKTNQPHLVKLFSDTIVKVLSKEEQVNLFKSIHINVAMARHIDYSILKILSSHGVPQSTLAQSIMQAKSGQRPGILLTIGIQLQRFTDWISRTTKEDNLKQCENKFKEFKRIFSTIHNHSSEKHSDSDLTPKLSIALPTKQ